jgi:hypothetical protein
VYPLAAPQGRQEATGGLEPGDALAVRRETQRHRRMVVASEMVGTGAQPHVKSAAARGLRDGQLGGEQEGVPERHVDHADSEGDVVGPARHGGQQRRRVPRRLRRRRGGHVIEAGDEVEA